MARGLMRTLCYSALTAATVGVGALVTAQSGPAPTEWKVWGGDPAQTHFSTLSQITPQNVTQLRPVWVYNPGTTGRGWGPLVIRWRSVRRSPETRGG